MVQRDRLTGRSSEGIRVALVLLALLSALPTAAPFRQAWSVCSQQREVLKSRTSRDKRSAIPFPSPAIRETLARRSRRWRPRLRDDANPHWSAFATAGFWPTRRLSVGVLKSRRRGKRRQDYEQRSSFFRLNLDASESEDVVAHGGAIVMLPMLGRLFGQSANLFQVGALFGTIPTLLAGLVCSYWAWQVLVAGSRDYQSRKTAEGIKACRPTAPKIGPGRLGFVDRPKLFDAEALRAEAGSRYNPTLLVYGERGSGKTVAVRLALYGTSSVLHVKLWAQDLDRPMKALSQAIIDASGADVTSSPALVAEAALRRLRSSGCQVPIVVIELDKRCTSSQLMAVLLAAKRWGDDENLAKFVVEAPSARIARGLPISLSDLRVEGVKVHPLSRKEALQVARGCVPLAAAREWNGGRHEDLAKYIVAQVGCGMLDLVRVGFAARGARDPLALHAAVDTFVAGEARAARGGVIAFLAALRSGEVGGAPEALERRLWTAIEGAAAFFDGGRGRNPGLDEVLDILMVSEEDFERAAGGVGPACPVAVDPFSYKVVVRSAFFKNALAAIATAQDDAPEEKNGKGVDSGRGRSPGDEAFVLLTSQS